MTRQLQRQTRFCEECVQRPPAGLPVSPVRPARRGTRGPCRKLGFAVRESLSVLQGTPPALSIPGFAVRPAHAHIVERPQGICAYATGFGYGCHAVAETNENLIALLASAQTFMGLGIVVPSRNSELLRWCLAHGLKIVQQSTLMTIGLYNEPSGGWLPSIAY
jgi:hypothetical protein